MMKKVSIIIPVYNAHNYLARCLDSVCNQTLTDIEIITVDDCSSDNSLDILHDYALKDKRIKVISCDKNGGESKARNIGLDAATGEYIAFVDNDDFIDLDFYEKLYTTAKKTDAEIVKAQVHEIGYNGENFYRTTNKDIITSGNKMLFNGDWWTAIYKKDFVNKNKLRLKEGYPLGADSLFVYLAVVNSKHLEVIFNTYYHYCRREDSGSSKILSLDKIKSFIKIIRIILEDINRRDESQLNKLGYDTIFAHFFDILASMPILSSLTEAKQICTQELFLAYESYKYNKNELFEKNQDMTKYKNIKNALANKNEQEIIASIKKRQIGYLFLNAERKRQQQNKIPVFLSADDNYAPFIATTALSILEHTKSFIEFYILDGGITNENKTKIYESLKQFNNFSIEFIKIDIDKYFKNFIETNHFNRTMYTRFLIPYLKPEIDKAIYSDVDVVFCGDIKEMWNENLDGFALGAVWEDFFEDSYNIERKKNADLSRNHKYFSSGNLLIDCKQWREKDILNSLLKIHELYKNKLQWPDQDILNKYFDCNYKVLDKKYCFVDPCYEFEKNPEFIIRHYTGNLKPWKVHPNIETTLFPDTQLFWKYIAQTPFYDKLINECVVKTQADLVKYKMQAIICKKQLESMREKYAE